MTIFKAKEEYLNGYTILWWKLSKKNWVGWKAMLLSLSGMEEDQQAQIGRKEFWTFTRLELSLGFGKLNYVDLGGQFFVVPIDSSCLTLFFFSHLTTLE